MRTDCALDRARFPAYDRGMVPDRDRERALDALRDGYADGAIGPDTLESRVHTVLASDCWAGVRDAVSDLPLRPARSHRRRGGGSGYRLLETLVGTRPLTLGRSSTCELVLTDDTVSRRHATLVRDGDAIVITDLGSTNGTRINGRRVTQAELRPGDRIELGCTQLGL
ncbi:MAG: hypothetical protein QOI80_3633 [Solirubrobacteraceae bacterium]|nr:hypothetical protein [Solirubrobacteraceae bacterium]